MQAVFFRDAAKGEPLGAKGLGGKPGRSVHFAVAVFEVAQNRVPQIGKMGADLVGAPGDQPDPAQRKGTLLPEHRNVGDDLFVVAAGPRMDVHFVVLFIVLQPGDMPPGRGRADGDRQVLLFHEVFLDDAVEIPQGGIGLGGKDQPFGPAVQPVAERGRKAVFGVRIVFAFFLQISGKRVYQVGIPGAVAVAKQVRRLVQYSKIPVFIDHSNGRLPPRSFGLWRRGVG